MLSFRPKKKANKNIEDTTFNYVTTMLQLHPPMNH